MTNIESRQHIIIEGCYLPPEHILDFEPEYLKQIIVFFIGFSKNYILNHYESGIIGHKSDIEQKEYDDYISRQNLIKMHLIIKDRCLANDVKFFEINDDYTEEIMQVHQWIDEQARSILQS